eukprot:TRINITY_DN2003_c0_g1_i6.p2 TRINITY_DN2003_c0_g1~~TRINITY_DN2003_c0_g1_i6.p2  ORF type:complete len:112 (-),score=18.95 TRINITY_DN2003_c0_g1_i6:257-592(-)
MCIRDRYQRRVRGTKQARWRARADQIFVGTWTKGSLVTTAHAVHGLLVCAVKLNGNRRVTGLLRGFDQFMNLVVDETVEEVSASERNEIGMVVIRGNSVVMVEALERILGV